MAMKPSIGELRHRIVIQSLTNTADSQGGFATTWSDLTTVWGSLEPARSNEVNFANQIQYRRSHVCKIRYNSQVTTAMRISFDSRLFQIKGLRRDTERQFFMYLDLEENVAT